MPCDMHRTVRTMLLLAALSMALAACKPTPDGNGEAEAANTPEPTRSETSTPPATTAQTDGPTLAPASRESDPEHWQCGDLLVDSRLSHSATQLDTLQLEFSGQALALQQMNPPSGVRYADSAGNAFAREGDDASLTLASGVQYECTRSTRGSSWTEAAARGIAFRAVGSEPGWLVEIGEGGAPSLHATLDYGQRDIDVAQMHPAAQGFGGKTVDGTTVTVDIQRKACQDGMSGQSFEAEATLVVGGKTYRGCGAYLSD